MIFKIFGLTQQDAANVKSNTIFGGKTLLCLTRISEIDSQTLNIQILFVNAVLAIWHTLHFYGRVA